MSEGTEEGMYLTCFSLGRLIWLEPESLTGHWFIRHLVYKTFGRHQKVLEIWSYLKRP